MPKYISLMCILCLSAVARAQDKPLAPSGHQPIICMAKAVKKDGGGVELQIDIPSHTAVSKSRFIVRNGEKFEERYQEYVVIIMHCIYVPDGKNIFVKRKDGNTVDPNELPGLLQKKTAVMVFPNSDLDPFYLQVAHDQVLVITCSFGPRGKVVEP